MKLQYMSAINIMKLSDEEVCHALMSSYQLIKDINAEMKNDEEVKRLTKELDELKSPYRKRILVQKSIANAAELVARSRGILNLTEVQEEA